MPKHNKNIKKLILCSIRSGNNTTVRVGRDIGISQPTVSGNVYGQQGGKPGLIELGLVRKVSDKLSLLELTEQGQAAIEDYYILRAGKEALLYRRLAKLPEERVPETVA